MWNARLEGETFHRLRDKLANALSPTDEWIKTTFGSGNETWTGESIVEVDALRISAVFACVRVLAESVSTLPCITYERMPDGTRRRALDHPYYRLLHDAPNPEMTSLQFFETDMAHLCLRGNCYIEKVPNGLFRDGQREIGAMYPITPTRVTKRRTDAGQIEFEIQKDDGTTVVLGPDKILHLRGLSGNGLSGYDPLSIHRETYGFSQAVAKAGSKFFANNLGPMQGYFKTPKRLGKPGRKRMHRALKLAHGGLDKFFRTHVLEEGMEWESIGISPENAQMLESRKYSVEDIARIYRVPPHMVGALDKATYSNIEHQGLSFVVYTLTAWLRRIEQELKLGLFGLDSPYYCEFLVEQFLRGDIVTRFKAYDIQRRAGGLTADEWRTRENQDPVGRERGGDMLIIPVNMQPVERLLEEPLEEEEPTGEPGEEGAAGRPHDKAGLPRAAVRGASQRRTHARAWRRPLEETYRKLLRRERARVLPEVKRRLQQQEPDAVRLWLSSLYEVNGEWWRTTRNHVTPVMSGFCEAMAAEASCELEHETEEWAGLASFTVRHIEGFASRYAGISDTLLGDDALEAENFGSDILDRLTARFDAWEENHLRARALATEESIQGPDAIARALRMFHEGRT
jgi:HK97 family phage portal protein